MKKIDKVYLENVKGINLSTTPILSTPENGYFPDGKTDPILEYWNTIRSFMTKYKIGKYLRRDKWGVNRINRISQILRDQLEKSEVGQVEPKSTNPLDLYDDLRDEVGGKEFTDADFARVARTETARIKAVYQLQTWQEIGVRFVFHKTRNDGRVSPQCQLHANKEYQISQLLSPSGETQRIPIHPNCRCRYEPSTREK